MQRTLVSASSGLSVTSLLLHFARFFERTDPPFLDPCPVCPSPGLDFLGPPAFHSIHLPSVLLGLGIGILVLPALELLLCIRGLVLARVDRVLRPPFRYRLL